MGALDGIRVLDLGQLVQAPQAAATLCDMGADVIKIELPGMGDAGRWLPSSATDPRPPYFIASNRGKRSVTCDLRKPGGRDLLLRLADTADVIVSNFKGGTLDDWGLSYETISARNPRIVYATGSLFGAEGPDATREGADLAGQAAGGLISTTGAGDEAPTPVGVTIADHIASQNMVAGILAALFSRERTGRGQRVDVSLLGGQIWAQASEFSAFLMSGEQPEKAHRGHSLINAIYGIFETSDGWIAMVGVPPALKASFFTAVGRADLIDDPTYAAMFITLEQKKALFIELAPSFLTKTTAEWSEVLRAAGQRFAPVNSYADVVANEGAWANGYFAEVEHHTYGTIKVVGSPIRMSDTPLVAHAAAPELGQHTEEFLMELGLAWEEIEALRADGAI
jgi:CoA:oxalate CoA-transferase